MTTELMITSPQDIKYWQIVQDVRQQFGKDCTNTRLACKRAGINHSLYYEALHSPYVQAMLVQELGARKQITHQVLEQAWAPILINMASLAASRDSKDRKEAVQAARLLVELESRLQDESKQTESSGKATHPARALLESARKTTFRRTTVVEEVEITPDTISDGNVIDVEST